jgi:microcystin-dependent protein
MAPVRLFDSPGYYVITDSTIPIPAIYQKLRAQGYDFVTTSSGAKTIKEEQVGGASVYRPLSYKEMDNNFKEVYPVGSVYMNADDPSNPATILGFGTWERMSSGKAILGTGKASDESTTLHNKIISAKGFLRGSQRYVTLKLQPRPLQSEIDQHTNNPALASNTFEDKRKYNLYPGLKINIQGIKKSDDSNGPTGTYTIVEVDSDLDPYPYKAPGSKSSHLTQAQSAAYDQNIVRFRMTNSDSGWIDGNFNVGGINATSTNAYYTLLDENSLLLGETGGDKDATIGIQQIPPHTHPFDENMRTRDNATGSAGKVDVKKAKAFKWDRTHTWDSNHGDEALVSSYGNPDWNHTRISDAGSGTTSEHENRQPIVAVHMWKRIG